MESKVAKNTSNYGSLIIHRSCNCAAIKHLLQQQLSVAIPSLHPTILGKTPRTLRQIPLHRLSDNSSILYRSAIALKLAPLLQLTALDIAKQLTATLLSSSQDSISQSSLEFKVDAISPGWIQFRLSDRSLATWLQQLIRIPPLLSNQGNYLDGGFQKRGGVGDNDRTLQTCKDSGNLFPIQYVHARCCSLLRLAHRQGAIALKIDGEQGCGGAQEQRSRGAEEQGSQGTSNWQIVEPNPIPWLNDNLGVEEEPLRLRLVHPAEWGLIAQVVDLLDATDDPTQVNWAKRGIALSQAFEEFYRNCRIWGEVMNQQPKLAQARLGLVGMTQIVMRSLLQDQLELFSPMEL